MKPSTMLFVDAFLTPSAATAGFGAYGSVGWFESNSAGNGPFEFVPVPE